MWLLSDAVRHCQTVQQMAGRLPAGACPWSPVTQSFITSSYFLKTFKRSLVSCQTVRQTTSRAADQQLLRVQRLSYNRYLIRDATARSLLSWENYDQARKVHFVFQNVLNHSQRLTHVRSICRIGAFRIVLMSHDSRGRKLAVSGSPTEIGSPEP